MSIPSPIVQYNLSDATMKGLLPAGYTPLAYIEFTGTQHIDTGVKANQNTIATVEVIPTSGSGNILGSRSGPSSNNFYMFYNSSATYVDFNAYDSSRLTAGITYGTKYLFYNSASRRQINSTSTTTAISGSFTTPTNLMLGAKGNDSGVGDEKLKGKVYHCTVSEGNTPKLDLRPAKRDSDGVLGMYDLVSRTFKTNSGSGTFIAGPPLAVGKGGGKSLPEEYQQVEYLESDGSQYINTGLVVTSSNGASYDFEAQVVPNSFPSGDVYYTVAGVNSNTQLAWKVGGKACIGNATSSGTFFTVGKMAKITAKFASSAQTYYVDGTSTGLSRAINTDTNIYLFGINVSGYNMKGKLQYAKFGTSAFFIPCYRKSDMKPGMYDVVRSTFYTNAGSGEFILGPTACPYYSWEPNAGSGTQQGLYTNVSSVYDSSKGWVTGFNGSNSRVYSSADLVSMFNTRTWSISFWFNTANLPTSEDASVWKRLFIYRKATTSDANTKQLVVYLTKTSIGTSFYGDDTAKTISGLAINTWYHVVITQNGGTTTYYVNGNSLGTSSKNSLAIPTGSYLQIGYDADRGMGAFNGKLSNVQIWNSVLTAAQVKELYGK